jgi:hypothetical protein
MPKPVPIFTTGNVGQPSVPFIPNSGTTFVSAYTGEILPGHPTFATPTGNTSGNIYFHGGIQIPGTNTVVCHLK